MPQNIKAHLFVILASFLVGGSFIVTDKLTGTIDPISITLLRFILASLILAPFILLIKKYRVKIFSTFKRTMIMSFFYSSYFIGMFKALETTSALNTGAIYTLIPLLTGIASIFVFKQYISSKQYMVYAFGIIGTCIVVFKGNLELFLAFSLNKGDFIFLFSIILMTLYSITSKYFYKKDDELLVVVFMTLIGGCIWMAISLIVFDVPLEWEKLNTTNLLNIGYLTIFTTLFTVFLYQSANVVLGPKKVMAYVYLNPAFVAIIAFIIDKTTMNFFTTIGILISAIATIILLKSK
ncbi:DMT family transporter [Poseidonibacter ostreae]|jgi:drug/metabolite transporter (DMT)-like permease|uniref:EamA family transporter n=1 Tax=Poseidonibacter ostreae TaxID=2654171 RepID=A0A6L4WT06_9BACT|nr:DMT family transporter [Poseidonibacter ostreae]KAB7887063.1 EamA family transporter [Poseidonibacter ostreae]KAB7889213.1 EamA family transporter [Poseidonibacter ostreae]KAB7891586.1 EamA family transporter [Poseidonibacter ostreae]MAC84096.1 EamA family transporter [Arcobacter sp.]|tara:strand:+ start:6947 stop:7828 length:882 start_codon:yes stop_codon:yes gene_type:complete